MLALFLLESFLVLILILILNLYIDFRHNCGYWKRKRIPQSTAIFPLGVLTSSILKSEDINVTIQKEYENFKKNSHKHGWLYFMDGPVYLPVNLKLIKQILLTDFDHFTDRGLYLDTKNCPLSGNIFGLNCENWRKLRMKINPAFTSIKVRDMFPRMSNFTHKLLRNIACDLNTDEDFDIKVELMNFCVDVIGGCAFDLDCGCLEHENYGFIIIMRKIFDVPIKDLIKVALEEGAHNPGNFFKLIENKKIVQDFFAHLTESSVKLRQDHGIIKDDLFNILIKMGESSEISSQETVAHFFAFMLMGFQTTFTALSLGLCELAENEQVQNKLREEIQENLEKDSTKWYYEDVIKLSYLDKIVKEILRKHTPLTMLNRICVKPYKIPETDIILDQGTPIIIPVFSIHRDEEYFPEPLKFDPERFNSEIIPFTYLPFGEGPKNCLGMRLGQMQIKLALAVLMNKFVFSPSSKTSRNLTNDPKALSMLSNSRYNLYMKIERI